MGVPMPDTHSPEMISPIPSAGQAQSWEDEEAADDPLEEDPGMERGERLHTSKVIARGGRSCGRVPGATAEKY